MIDEHPDELERRVLRRDRRFVGRLAVVLGLSIAGAVFLYGKLTSTSIGDCAAKGFGGVTQSP